MKARAESITLTMSKKEGMELRNQIIELTEGTMILHTELKGTPIAELFELLSGNFENSTVGINFSKGA
jgi:hypothetical protein